MRNRLNPTETEFIILWLSPAPSLPSLSLALSFSESLNLTLTAQYTVRGLELVVVQARNGFDGVTPATTLSGGIPCADRKLGAVFFAALVLVDVHVREPAVITRFLGVLPNQEETLAVFVVHVSVKDVWAEKVADKVHRVCGTRSVDQSRSWHPACCSRSQSSCSPALPREQEQKGERRRSVCHFVGNRTAQLVAAGAASDRARMHATKSVYSADITPRKCV